jgi:hypothetical protein
LSIQHRFS